MLQVVVCIIVVLAASVSSEGGSGLSQEEDGDNSTAYTVEIQPFTSDVVPDIYPSTTLENEQLNTLSLQLSNSDDISSPSSGPHLTLNNLESQSLTSHTSVPAISTSGVDVSESDILPSSVTGLQSIVVEVLPTPSLRNSIILTHNVMSSITTNSVPSVVRDSRTTQTSPVDIPIGALAGIVLALTITVLALCLSLILIVFLCYCCFKSKQYAHTAAGENRMAIQPWQMTNMMRRSFSISSFGSGRSRGSGSGWSRRSGSLFGSLSSLRHHSDSKEQVTSIINQSIPDLYSTPL